MPQVPAPLAAVKGLPSFERAGLPEAFLDEHLPGHGITSAEDFLGVLQAESKAVAEATGADLAALEDLYLEAVEVLVPPERREMFTEPPSLPGILGAAAVAAPAVRDVEEDRLDRSRLAAEFPGPAALTASVSLIDGCMPPARDQGARPTCTVFAALGVLEYLLCRFRGERDELSEQYLYWQLSRNGALDVSGRAQLRSAFDLARTIGVCVEALWRYAGHNLPGDLTHGNPPNRAASDADAVGHRFDTVHASANPRDVAALRQLLASDHPVAVTIPLFPSFIAQSFRSQGRITLPVVPTTPFDHHSLVLVGYRPAPTEPGGEVFLVRNSMGPTWGSVSGLGEGLGTIPVEYVRRHATEACTGRL